MWGWGGVQVFLTNNFISSYGHGIIDIIVYIGSFPACGYINFNFETSNRFVPFSYNQMIKILSHASRWSLRCCNSEVLDFATSKISSTSLTSHHPEQLNHLNLAFLGLSLSFSFHSVLCWKKRILRLFLPSLLCCTSRVVQLFFIWVANKNMRVGG